jgi:UDP-hydrolysing UDP-N-acetyl-D-glucosamine 2-epimerase
MKRTIGVVSGARADFGLYRPILRAILAEPALELRLLVCGMHLAADFGHTVDEIVAEGFPIAERIETLLASDTPAGVAKSMGLGVAGFAQSYARARPDILLLLGDRYEMFAAATAALPFVIPIAHIHGGETTEGAIDEAIRHALTKMSHIHFVATEDAGRRVIRMGEQPSRVLVSGAPALDNLSALKFLDRAELERATGFPFDPAPLLTTVHPTTLEHEDTGAQIDEVMAALSMARRPVLFTFPNADTSGRRIIDAIRHYVAAHPNAAAVPNLGGLAYFSAMRLAAAVVGNSSSGIIEAASFQTPVVNIGSRQRGRLRARNVIDAAPRRDAIIDALERALAPSFREGLAGLVNPYGDGRAADRIVRRLKDVPLDLSLVEKVFYDA